MAWLQLSFWVFFFVALCHCKVTYEITNVPDECLHNKAIAVDYTPLGKNVVIGNLTVYEYEPANNTRPNRLLINAYDVFGFEYDNLKQVTDLIANQHGGFKAVLPDFFRGDNWADGRNVSERPEWLERVGSWENVVKPDLINIVRHYESQGVVEFAIFGFCWGGKIATLAATELSDLFKVGAMVHPSNVANEEADDVKIPLYLMPAQNDIEMSPFYAVLQEKFGDNCGHRRFDTMTHGFAGARGNYSDPETRENVDEVIETLGDFFNRNLNSSGNLISILSGYLLIVSLIVAISRQ